MWINEIYCGYLLQFGWTPNIELLKNFRNGFSLSWMTWTLFNSRASSCKNENVNLVEDKQKNTEYKAIMMKVPSGVNIPPSSYD